MLIVFHFKLPRSIFFYKILPRGVNNSKMLRECLEVFDVDGYIVQPLSVLLECFPLQVP